MGVIRIVPDADIPDGPEGAVLDEIQHNVFERARRFREENTVDVNSLDEFIGAMEDGCFARCHWGGDETDAEDVIKDKTKASLRVIPLDGPEEEGACIVTGKPSKRRVIFAKAY